MPVHKTEELYVYEHTVLLMNGAAEQRLADAAENGRGEQEWIRNS
jgi:hypothetical protein